MIRINIIYQVNAGTGKGRVKIKKKRRLYYNQARLLAGRTLFVVLLKNILDSYVAY